MHNAVKYVRHIAGGDTSFTAGNSTLLVEQDYCIINLVPLPPPTGETLGKKRKGF